MASIRPKRNRIFDLSATPIRVRHLASKRIFMGWTKHASGHYLGARDRCPCLDESPACLASMAATARKQYHLLTRLGGPRNHTSQLERAACGKDRLRSGERRGKTTPPAQGHRPPRAQCCAAGSHAFQQLASSSAAQAAKWPWIGDKIAELCETTGETIRILSRRSQVRTLSRAS